MRKIFIVAFFGVLEYAKDMTGKMKLFIYYYPRLKLNATAAATKAGYSQKTAYSQGQRLLKNVELKRLIQKEIKEMLSDTELLTLKWLNEVQLLSFSRISDFVNDDGSPKDVSSIDRDLIAAVESISTTTKKNKKNGDEEETVTNNLRLAPKVQALNLLGKYLAILQDNPPEPADEKEKMDKKDQKERLAYLLKKREK